MVDFCGVLLKPGRSAESASRIVAGMLAERDDQVFECHDRQIDDHLWLGFAEPKVFQHERARRGMITVRDGFACFGDVALYNRDRLNNPDVGDDDVSILHRWLRRDGDLGIVNGDFSAGTYDLEKRKLKLFRDQIGAGAILHVDHPDGLVFANNARFLPGAGLPNFELDPLALAGYVALQFAIVHRHYFKGVHDIPLAHQVCAEPGAITPATRYWGIEDTKDHGFRGQDCIEYLRELFTRAVAARIEGAERPGISLSGGLDSSSVAGAVTHLRPNEQIFGFAHRAGTTLDKSTWGDDAPYLDIVGTHWPNLTLKNVTSNHKDVFHGASFWAEHALIPCSDRGYFGTSALQDAAVEAGVDVLLDGYAGDDTLSCWGHHMFYEALLSGKFRLAVQEIRRLLTDRRRSLWSQIRTSLIRPLVPQFIMEARARRRGEHWTKTTSLYDKWFSDPDLQAILVDGELDDLGPSFVRMRDNIVGALSISNSNGYNYAKSYTGNRGLRQRSPMQDRDLISAVYWTPLELFVTAKRDRELIRSVCAPYLPDPIKDRSDKAAFIPDLNSRIEQAIDKTPELTDKPDNIVWSEVVNHLKWSEQIEERRTRMDPPDHWNIFLLMHPPVSASRFVDHANAIIDKARRRQLP